MKYFTPELLQRYGSRDKTIAEAAEVEWERACKAYRKRLRAMEAKLPRSVLEFLRHYNMHDARLITFGLGKGPDTLSLLFQLDGTEEALLLTYWLVREKSEFTLPARKKGPLEVEWLYDELDVLDKRAFKHSILLTGGVELGLAFTKLQLLPFRKWRKSPLKAQEVGEIGELVAS